jgi:hypothetical protein
MNRWGFVLLVIVMIFVALAEVAGTESKPEGGSLAAREKQETTSLIWGKAGFLLQDQKRLSGEQSTIMRFTKGKEKAEPVPE